MRLRRPKLLTWELSVIPLLFLQLQQLLGLLEPFLLRAKLIDLVDSYTHATSLADGLHFCRYWRIDASWVAVRIEDEEKRGFRCLHLSAPEAVIFNEAFFPHLCQP